MGFDTQRLRDKSEVPTVVMFPARGTPFGRPIPPGTPTEDSDEKSPNRSERRYSGTMMTKDSVSIRAVKTSDSSQWAELYRGYRAFYELSPDDSIVERVWTWIHDDSNEVNAFVAISGDRLVGLAHYRRFSRPSTGSVGIYLDDLFTDSTARGAGVGRALLSELSALAEREGHSVVRWITAEDNTRARRLYDLTATSTKWVTYDLAPGAL
ncbi:L-amino acid N-acyltransferase YncA [Cryobacterium flavum]|uniref:L-amino acid N-acyltransferase YncA n=2 Tax=Cryobacterium flavum TaxID=1424659 RepID=A0A5E9G441_9MICO|nr:L-amino acid N-acyltransferase YncA [Cryobacterium flavum]